MRPAIVAAFLTALLLTGCKPDAAVHKGAVLEPAALPASPAQAPADAGKVTGVISFAGTPPARVPIDMSMDPACAMSGGENLSEQFIVAHGKLANVFVTVRKGAPATRAPQGQPAVVLDQKGCRYVPHVIALQQGGAVDFRNSDATVHNVHAMPIVAGDQTIDLSEQPGASKTVTFARAETMMPVRCNNHPWMNAFINVAETPYFAISGTDGSYTLTGLPPGTYTIAAVHEKLGEQDTVVTVPARGTAQANFSFAAK